MANVKNVRKESICLIATTKKVRKAINSLKKAIITAIKAAKAANIPVDLKFKVISLNDLKHFKILPANFTDIFLKWQYMNDH